MYFLYHDPLIWLDLTWLDLSKQMSDNNTHTAYEPVQNCCRKDGRRQLSRMSFSDGALRVPFHCKWKAQTCSSVAKNLCTNWNPWRHRLPSLVWKNVFGMNCTPGLIVQHWCLTYTVLWLNEHRSHRHQTPKCTKSLPRKGSYTSKGRFDL